MREFLLIIKTCRIQIYSNVPRGKLWLCVPKFAARNVRSNMDEILKIAHSKSIYYI